MYRTLFLPIILLITLSAFASDARPVTSRPVEVKVFLQGAQVTRSASTSIRAGLSQVIFTGLSSRLDPQSLQITGKGGYTILSVEHRVDHLTQTPKKKEIEELKEQIKKLEHDHHAEKGLQQVWEQEEQLLLKNTVLAGQNGITPAQLQGVNEYVRERLKAVKAGWLAQQQKLNAISEELSTLRQQMQQYQGEVSRPTSEVLVEISSTADVSATFLLSYFVKDAGWSPAYDLRAKSVTQPVELLMKAQVVNNTGEDWDRVAMVLGSGNPTLGGTMPALHPWTIHPSSPPSVRGARVNSMMKAESDLAEAEDVEARYTLSNTVEHRATTFEFKIDMPLSIPSDARPYTIGLRSQELPATYQHYITPKLEKDAFLYARTTGWEDLDLLSGKANIFFEGTYIGQTHLNLDRPVDTLEISLGRDKSVLVERVKRKTTNDKAFIGSKRTITTGWDITVRNTKNSEITVELRDQFPLSPLSEIEVKLEEKGDAVVDENKGFLTWTYQLAPKASKKSGFSYSIRYPGDMPLALE